MTVTQRNIDKKNLTIAQFIDKYYTYADLKGWNYWIKNNIELAGNKDQRTAFLNNWGKRMESFNFDKMERFYKEKNLSDFDEDVRKFFAFLEGDGFFKSNSITFEKWIYTKNFTNPLKEYPQDIAIIEALKLKGGMNYIRKQLVSLHWWRE